jgi:hypothetical protein
VLGRREGAQRREGHQVRRALEGDARQPGHPDRLAPDNLTAKKRNTDLAFLIGGNDAAMDEETRAWYDAHHQAFLRPPSTASSSPSTMSTPVADKTSPPEAQEGTTDEPVVV